jgi:hypothetical protein
MVMAMISSSGYGLFRPVRGAWRPEKQVMISASGFFLLP